MGNVSSSLEELPTLYMKNPNRFQLTEIVVSNSAHDPYITFPATPRRITALPNTIDLLEFIQDPDVLSIAPNKFLLKLSKDINMELKFKFQVGGSSGNKTELNGLTFINAANEKDLDRMLTVEFNDDPNLHKHPNVAHLGDYESDGTKPSEVEWTWKWAPPNIMDETHRGWRNHCCFAEYHKKENTFQILGSFTFWVADSAQRFSYHRHSKSTGSFDGPFSPITLSTSLPNFPRNLRPSSPESSFLPPTISLSTPGNTNLSIPIGGRRSSDDSTYQHEPEDGPLFRATLAAYEKKAGSLRHHIKRILKAGAISHEALINIQEANQDFLLALKAAAVAHPQSFQPVLDNYLEEAFRKMATNRENMTNQMQVLLLEPLRKLYENDIKVADTKKKEFEEESRDYYQFLSKYLSIKVDSAKEKKKLESDSKYQNKRKTFELKRFDYYAYVQDLHGGRKDQEILYHLTNFAEKQYAYYQQTAMGIQDLKPGLEKLATSVAEAAKEIHLMRKEREERRRTLETRAMVSNPFPSEPFNEDFSTQSNGTTLVGDNQSDGGENGTSPAGSPTLSQARFKGIRDMENHDAELVSAAGRKKEGFLFATPRATQHGAVDPLAKTNWHKYWCVLAGGQLCEYSNWKKQLETHNEPINLRFATVREARGTERRFCFEVITPQYRRIYQATSAEDMNSWMAVISNAIESLLNGTSSCRNLDQLGVQEDDNPGAGESLKRPKVRRRGTLSSLTDKKRASQESGVLEIIKNADSANSLCADCGSRRTEWCSINLGIVLCIECSGIHRSLGTHISKIRSLTLDTTSYTSDLLELIRSMGNTRSNTIWEAKLLEAKPAPTETKPSQPEINLDIPEAILAQIETPSDIRPVPPPKTGPLKPNDVADTEWVDVINTSPSVNPATLSKKLPLVPKPASSDSRAIKQKFITAKYVERAYVNLSLIDESRTATDILFEAIKKNDIPGAMQAIALKADVNATRRFEVEDDHGLKTPLLLALLHLKNPTMTEDGERQLFPMAELLLQNGALVEKTFIDDLEDQLGETASIVSKSNSTKSAGAWAAEVVGELKRRAKTTIDIVRASGNDAAIKYLTPKALARGASPTPSSNQTMVTTSTGGVASGAVSERKGPNLGRSLSMSVRNALS